MTAHVVAVLPVTRPKAGPELDHLYCACDENLSLCGLDISDLPIAENLPDLCVVCDDLTEATCKDCGE